MVHAGEGHPRYSESSCEEEEGSDEECVEFEVVFGPDAVVEPFAVVVEEFDAPSAAFAVIAITIFIDDAILV